MAFSSSTEWDVRVSGADSNGGGFNTASAGTDYSKQDSPQVTYTDLVIDATTNTKCTSAGNPFTSAHVGNIINITSGTGFTVQRVQVVSVTTAVATCDKSLGTLSSTGGNGKLGGALLTLGTAGPLVVSGNTVHVKAGTYTLTSAVSMAIGTQYWRGFGTAHNDHGTKPLITTATNSTQLFNAPAQTVALFENLSMSNTAGTRGDGVRATGNYPTIFMLDCLLDGFDKGVNGDNGGGTSVMSSMCFENTEIKNCVTAAITAFQFMVSVAGCYIHDNTQDGIRILTGNQTCAITNSVLANNGRYAVLAGGAADSLHLDGVVFYKNGKTFTGQPFNAINCNTSCWATMANCVFYGGTTAYTNSGLWVVGRSNAFDATALSAAAYASIGDVVLSVDPFTSGTNFALNSTAGGGAALKTTGFPGAAAFGASTAKDIGAVQTSGGGGGGSLATNPLGGFVV